MTEWRAGLKEHSEFEMDGTEHEMGLDCWCFLGEYSRHKECGGLLHYQAIYGGWYFQCEICGETGLGEMKQR